MKLKRISLPKAPEGKVPWWRSEYLWVPLLAVRGGNRGEGERAQRRASLRTLAVEGLEGAADLLAQQAQGRWIVQVDEAARKVAGSDRRRRRHLLTAQLLHGLCASACQARKNWCC